MTLSSSKHYPGWIHYLPHKKKVKLQELQNTFNQRITSLSPQVYKKEFERLAIDLSWKSSQIEGNTYTLLETERLLQEKITASGRTKDEATMVLNHKAAIDFIMEHPETFERLSIRSIEEIHSILIAELDIFRNIRHSRVGVPVRTIGRWIINIKSTKRCMTRAS